MRQTAVLTGLFLWAVGAFAADPGLLNLVMPDAKILAGVNVTNAKISPFGQFLLARAAAVNKGVPRILKVTGFDPRNDLTELLFATAADPANPGGLALARGTFNVDMIGAAAAKHKNLSVQTYDGDTLIVATNPKTNVSHAVAFIGGTISVAGDLADVKAALDRGSGANSIDPTLAADVNTLSTTDDAWIVSSVGLPGKNPPQALKAISSFEGGVKFGATIQASGQAIANSPQNAQALSDVIHLLTTAGTMNASLNQLLPDLQTSVSGATLNVTFTAPEAQVETLLNALAARRRQQGSASGQAVRPRVR